MPARGKSTDSSSAALPPREGPARRVRSEQTSSLYSSGDPRSPAGTDPDAMRMSSSRDDMVYKSSSSIKYTLPDPLLSAGSMHGISASERRSRREAAAASVAPRYEPSVGTAAPKRTALGREGVTDYVEQRAAAAGLSGEDRPRLAPSSGVPIRPTRAPASSSGTSSSGSSNNMHISGNSSVGASAGSSSSRSMPAREGADRRPAGGSGGGEVIGLGLIGRRYDPTGVIVGARADGNPSRGPSSRSQPQAPPARDPPGARRSSDKG
jgi:hypothetical protein